MPEVSETKASQALNERQREFIQSILDDLLDLPSEEKELTVEIAQLELALQEDPLDPEHRYAQLQKCFLHPTDCFFHLEVFNPDISIGLVQEHVLQSLTQLIQKAASSETPLSSLGWNPEVARAKLREDCEAFSRPFKSASSPFDSGIHPWQIFVPSEKIYTIELIQQREFLQIQVLIKIDLPNWGVLEGQPIEYPNDVQTDEEEDRFVLGQHTIIRDAAEKQVSDVLLDHLVKASWITPEEKQLIKPGAQFLLLHRFYFNAVAEGRIPFRVLKDINANQANLLVEPALMALIDAGKCDVGFVENLTPAEFNVCKNPYYLKRVLEDPKTQNLPPLTLQEFKGVSSEKSFLLNLPSVTSLQQQGKMSYQQAKEIHPRVTPIFQSQLCIQLILEDKLPITRIRSLKRKNALLLATEYYTAELFKERLSLDEIDQFSEYEVDNLLQPSLIELQKRGHLSRNDAKVASQSACRLLQDQYYFNLVLQRKDAFHIFLFFQSLTPDQVDCLLHPKIKKLIRHHKLGIKDATQFTNEEWHLLTQTAIFNLYYAGKIKLADLHRIPPTLGTVLCSKTIFYEMLMQEVFTLKDCLNCLGTNEAADQPFTEFGLHYGGRLIGLLKGKPYHHFRQVDSLSSLIELMEAPVKTQTDPFRMAFQSHILRVFFRFLQHEFFPGGEPQNPDSFYTRFLSTLNFPDPTLLERRDTYGVFLYLSQLDQLVSTMKQKMEPFEANPEARYTRRGYVTLSVFTPSAPEEDHEKIKILHGVISEAASMANIIIAKPAQELSPTMQRLSLGMQ